MKQKRNGAFINFTRALLNAPFRRFFFPDDTKLKIEAVTNFSRDRHGKITIHREFHTFRALVMFIRDEYFAGRARREAKQNGFTWGSKHWMLDPQRGAFAFDATANSNFVNNNPLTFSHTCAGSDRMLIVSSISSGWGASSGATYAGSGMTAGINIQSAYSGGQCRAYSYYKGNPATGSNNVVISFGGGCDAIGGAVSFSGADQTIGNMASANGEGSWNSAATATVNITSQGVNNFIVDNCGFTVAGTAFVGDLTVGAGQTQRWNTRQNSGSYISGGGSTEQGSGSRTMSWVTGTPNPNGGNNEWVITAIEVKEVVASGNTNFAGFME